MQAHLSEGWIAELKKQDEDLASMVTKWRPRILALAHKLARNTGDEFEDVVQDFLQKMWTDIEYYKVPQVRYTKQIWEVRQCIEDTLHLRRTANGKTQEIFLKKSETEEIKKSSLGTFVYAGLQQYYLDRQSSHYTAKNGYAVNEADPKTKRTTTDGQGNKVVKEFTNFHKVSGVVQSAVLLSEGGQELDVVDLAPSNLESPEDLAIYDDLIGHVRSHVGDEAKRLLDFFLMADEDYLVMMDLEILRQQEAGESISATPFKLDEIAAAKYFNKSRTEIRELRMEIIESLPKDFLSYSTISYTPEGQHKRTELVRSAISLR
jgi:hypothetical protein